MTMAVNGTTGKTALWAITPNGAALAVAIAEKLPGSELFLSSKLPSPEISCNRFDRLKDAIRENFSKYPQHVFIMSTGIVVRLIAPLIQNKTKDPAVVVVDEKGHHAISLLSGHIGGANALAETIGLLTGAYPVISTATDINQVPAIDRIAVEKNLFIENPDAIKAVNMAFITGKKVVIHDPYCLVIDELPETLLSPDVTVNGRFVPSSDQPAVYVDDTVADLPTHVLKLRPKSLVAGIGCNRQTGMDEIKFLLLETFDRFHLAVASLANIATIDIKHDEPGILSLAKELGLPVDYFTREALSQVENIQTPSLKVERHIGVKSVCEAAAILSANNGNLIVTKQISKNATLAVARRSSIS